MPKKSDSLYIVTASVINRGGGAPVFAGNAVRVSDFADLPEDTVERHVANGALRPATDEETEREAQGLLPRPGAQPPNVPPSEVAAAQPPELQALRQEVADLQARLAAVEAAAQPERPTERGA